MSSSRRKISGKESTWFVLSAFRAQTHDRFRRLKKKRLFIGSVDEEASISEICKRSNDLSFTLEKPCFYSYVRGCGTRC